MNLRDLTYLVAVADARHFGRAAQACHVSQPTLSSQIRKMEEFLGVVLFERDNRNVALTPAGEAIVEKARAALALTEAMKDLANTFRDPLAGELRLGIISSIGPFLAADLLAQLAHDAPRLDIRLLEGLTDELLAALRAGQLDAALIATSPDDGKLDDRALFDEPFLIAHAPTHQLASKPTLNMSDIANGSLLLLREGHCLRDQALALCGSTLVDARVESTSVMTLIKLAETGKGVTLVPALAAPQAQNLVLRPLDSGFAYRRIRLVSRRQFPRAAALEVVSSVVMAIARTHGLKALDAPSKQ